jgi:hypothetical protein
MPSLFWLRNVPLTWKRVLRSEEYVLTPDCLVRSLHPGFFMDPLSFNIFSLSTADYSYRIVLLRSLFLNTLDFPD